jgi:hypothetical protein
VIFVPLSFNKFFEHSCKSTPVTFTLYFIFIVDICDFISPGQLSTTTRPVWTLNKPFALAHANPNLQSKAMLPKCRQQEVWPIFLVAYLLAPCLAFVSIWTDSRDVLCSPYSFTHETFRTARDNLLIAIL